jgi:hypothetical protein
MDSKIRRFGTTDRVAPSPRGCHDGVMPDRSYPAVEALIRRVQRVAAGRPDPLQVLAATIGMTGTIGMDPYAVLGILIEGAVQTLAQQIPPERQAQAAAELIALVHERLKAHGLTDNHDGSPSE